MLTNVHVAGDRKQIVLSFNASSGTVLYTVPAGKTCVGVIFGGGATVNNISMASSPPAPVTLIAGTVLAAYGSSSTGYFIGVEQ